MKSSKKSRPQNRAVNLLGVRSVAFAFICVLWCTAAALTARQSGETGEGATRVMALETLWNQAEVDKDVQALSQLIPDTFVYVDIDGSTKTKPEFLEGVKSGPEHPTEIRNESIIANTYSNTVIVTGVHREKGTLGGKQYSRRGRFIDTWIQTNGAWLCVASQSTLIAK
jgi:ketosteroid isomerase-like protein